MSRRVVRAAFAVCLWFASVIGAAAQDDRKVGLTIGYPSAGGVIWQVSKRVAIRTDTSFSSTWTDTDTEDAGDEFARLVGSSASTSGHSIGIGVSALFTVARWERLRAYVAPRAAYVRSSSKSEISFSAGLPGIPSVTRPATFETKGSTQTYGASFGTQYGLGDRFAAFGEVGVVYSTSRSSDTTTLVFSSGSSTEPQLITGGVVGVPISGAISSFSSSFSSSPRPRTNSLGIRSGVGVIFFF